MKMELAVHEIESLLEKREKLLNAQEFYMKQYAETKGDEKRISNMRYFGIVSRIKQIDYTISLRLIELESTNHDIPKQTLEQKLAGFRTLVVG